MNERIVKRGGCAVESSESSAAVAIESLLVLVRVSLLFLVCLSHKKLCISSHTSLVHVFVGDS